MEQEIKIIQLEEIDIQKLAAQLGIPESDFQFWCGSARENAAQLVIEGNLDSAKSLALSDIQNHQAFPQYNGAPMLPRSIRNIYDH